MSSTSINFTNHGYTSPDFIKNLFKPITTPTSSQTTYGSFRSISSLNKIPSIQDQLSRRQPSPPKPFPTKLMRSSSLFEEDRTMIRKVKIFYQALMHGMKKQSEVEEGWRRFEISLENPYLFDRYIEEIQAKSLDSEESKIKNKNQIHLKSLELDKPIVFSHSIPKVKPKSIPSEEKVHKSAGTQQRKNRIKKSIRSINKIMDYGDKFMHER